MANMPMPIETRHAATSSGVETIDRERELSPESLKGFI